MEQPTQILEAMRLEIVRELNDIAIYHPATDDWEVTTPESSEADESLQADAAEAADARSAELTELETRYRAIVRALHKIEMGTYGICEISGEGIEPERLAANPAARTTIAHMDQESLLPL